MAYKSDIEIAQSVTPEHILKIAERAHVDKLARAVERLENGEREGEDPEDEEEVVLDGIGGAFAGVVGVLALSGGREEERHDDKAGHQEDERQIGCDILRPRLRPGQKGGDNRQVQRDDDL